MQIPESDWKLLRKISPLALERFCETVLAEVSSTASDKGKSFHERYLTIFALMQKRDRQLGNAFDNARRSIALFQLGEIFRNGLITEDELSRFTPETQQVVRGEWKI